MKNQQANKQDARTSGMHKLLEDILLAVSWREIARQYFNQDAAWLYDRLNGRESFTAEEREQLKGALCDLSDRIRRAAEKIEATGR